MSNFIGQIVKNLIPSEPLVINQMQDLGSIISLNYTGVNSNISSIKIISREAFEKLGVLTALGQFNFTGNPKNSGCMPKWSE